MVSVKSPRAQVSGRPASRTLADPVRTGGTPAATGISDHVSFGGAATWFIDSFTRTIAMIWALAPTPSSPNRHEATWYAPCCLSSHVPCDGVADWYGLSAARSVLPSSENRSTPASVPDRLLGPLFVAVTVIVTSSPFFTGLGEADCVTTRLADAPAGTTRSAPATRAVMPIL